jgi:DNA-directed RNA polymerase
MSNENQSHSQSLLPEELNKLEFDDWKNLYNSDPELFEKYRKQLLEQQIALAPESSRPRLLGLMFQMEAEALRSRTPIGLSLRLSAMMMDEFEKLRQYLALITGDRTEINTSLQSNQQTAEIIPINRFRPEETPEN